MRFPTCFCETFVFSRRPVQSPVALPSRVQKGHTCCDLPRLGESSFTEKEMASYPRGDSISKESGCWAWCAATVLALEVLRPKDRERDHRGLCSDSLSQGDQNSQRTSKAMEGEAVLSGFSLVAYLLGRGQKSAWGSGDSSSS